jgi:Raf kinase inhibitor-like YbhB/YbcL family protein
VVNKTANSIQVLANGGAAGLFVLLTLVFPDSAWVWAGFAGSLAAANADTWATELGVLSPTLPRLITSGRTVENGTSGAISPVGTLAAAAGSLLIALLAAILWPNPAPGGVGGFLLRLGIVLLAGIVGSLVDSLLGATWQAIYFCPSCAKETERHPLHSCGTPTRLQRGFPWLDNDTVNGACTLAGALVAAILAGVLIFATTPFGQSNQLPTLPLSSPAFLPGAAIPAEYSCDGANGSPALSWGNLPPGTRSLALIVEDPDAPLGTFTHWVLYNLPPSLSGLPAGVPPDGGAGTQGSSSFGQNGYSGPCPPADSQHRYFFRLYALNIEPNLPAGLDRRGLLDAIEGHVLATGELVGTFSH